MSRAIDPMGSEGQQIHHPMFKCTGCLCDHQYTCEVNRRYAIGGISLISAVAMIILAAIFAAGVWGVGNSGFIAGGLAIGSMITFGVAAVCLIPREEKLIQ